MKINRFSLMVLFVGFGFILSGCPATTQSTSDTATMEEPPPVPEVEEVEMVEPEPEPVIVETPMAPPLAASDFVDVYFDYDKSAIRSETRAVLERTASLLKDNPGARLKIEGHCDERGTNAYNLALGERRAKSIKEFLVALGVSSSRLSTISYGEERPTCSNTSESCYSKNRRGHFVLQ